MSALVPRKVSKKDAEKIKELIAKDKSRRNLEAVPIREAYKAAKVADIIKRNPRLTAAKAREQVERLYEKAELGYDWLLYLEGYDKPVSVSEIVANPKQYHGKHCLPPMDEDDPDYQRYCAIIYSNQPKPGVFSQAHGGIFYALPNSVAVDETGKQKEQIRLPSRAITQAQVLLRKMAEMGQFYSRPQPDGRCVISINKKKWELEEVNQGKIYNRLENTYEINDENGHLTELPERTLKLITQIQDEFLPIIRGIKRLPVIKNSKGEWQARQGYDPEAESYLTQDYEINTQPGRTDTREALAYLLSNIINQFSYRDPDIARGVFLSQLIGFMIMPLTDTRPALVVSGTGKNTGKSSVGQILHYFAEETIEGENTFSDEKEINNSYLNAYNSGRASLLWDNLPDGWHLSSALLSGFLTMPRALIRRFHTQNFMSVENAFLQIFTGTNLEISGDNDRRCLSIYMEKQADTPWTQDPVIFIQNHRQEVIQAVATLASAYFAAGAPKINGRHLDSFSKWDRYARQSVLWLATEFPSAHIGDPVEAVKRQKKENPVQSERKQMAALIIQLLEKEKHSSTAQFESGEVFEWVGQLDATGPAKKLGWLFQGPGGKREVTAYAIGTRLSKIRGEPLDLEDGRIIKLQRETGARGDTIWRFEIIQSATPKKEEGCWSLEALLDNEQKQDATVEVVETDDEDKFRKGLEKMRVRRLAR